MTFDEQIILKDKALGLMEDNDSICEVLFDAEGSEIIGCITSESNPQNPLMSFLNA